MIPPFDGFTWLFPHPWAIGVWFTFLAASFAYSFLVNGQTKTNKFNNMRKYALVFIFFSLVIMVAQVLQPTSQANRIWHAPTAGLLSWVVLVTGDWLAFYLHTFKFHPGGVQGWFWYHLNQSLEYHARHAKEKFKDSLDEAEKQLAFRERTFIENLGPDFKLGLSPDAIPWKDATKGKK